MDILLMIGMSIILFIVIIYLVRQPVDDEDILPMSDEVSRIYKRKYTHPLEKDDENN